MKLAAILDDASPFITPDGIIAEKSAKTCVEGLWETLRIEACLGVLGSDNSGEFTGACFPVFSAKTG
jgi:hypothetical protein